MKSLVDTLNEGLNLTKNGFSEDVSISIIEQFAEEILKGIKNLGYINRIRVLSEKNRCVVEFGSVEYTDDNKSEQSYRDIEKCVDDAKLKVFKENTFEYELGSVYKISKWGIYNYHIYPSFSYRLDCSVIRRAKICSSWLIIYCEYEKYHDVFKKVFAKYK